MHQSTPISLQKKIKFLKQNLDELYKKVSQKQQSSQQPSQQFLRIKLISFLDDNIDRILQLNSDNSQQSNTARSYKDKKSEEQQSYKDKFYESEKQKIQLQRKLMQLREKAIKQQEHALDLQKMDTQNITTRHRLQQQIRKMQKTIKQLNEQMSYLKNKVNHQEQQMQRLIRLNENQHEQIKMASIQRSRAQKQLYEMKQKYETDQSQNQISNNKGQKFNYKNTQGLRNVRIFTNLSSQKKSHQKYFLLELPVKIEIQKIVYGIRIGTILPNKEIFYFNQLFLYEKDPMKIELQGNSLQVEYLKRKQKVLLDKYKINRPQILILLYGRGDSVMIDETKQSK